MWDAKVFNKSRAVVKRGLQLTLSRGHGTALLNGTISIGAGKHSYVWVEEKLSETTEQNKHVIY